MPKLKTHSGAKKRFKMTKKGKIKRAQAFRRHILNKKSTKRKRLLRKGCLCTWHQPEGSQTADALQVSSDPEHITNR